VRSYFSRRIAPGAAAFGIQIPAKVPAIGTQETASNEVCSGYSAVVPRWPEVAAFAREYEDRFGAEVTPAVLLGLLLPQWLSQALEKAGTVTDVERIIEVLETETFDTSVGPVQFGGEEINGIGHILMLPQPIWKIVGPGEYEIEKVYTAEELEALAKAIYGGGE